LAIGGGIGAEIDISKISTDLRSDLNLFSESNTRWIVEVKKEKVKEFEKNLTKLKTPYLRFGKTIKDRLIIKDENHNLIDQKINKLSKIWKNAIWDVMG
jgi:phosphoribosylformylglycinamidine synthase